VIFHRRQHYFIFFLTILDYMCLVSLYNLCSFFFFYFLSCLSEPFMWIYVPKEVFLKIKTLRSIMAKRPKGFGPGMVPDLRWLDLTCFPDPRCLVLSLLPDPSRLGLSWFPDPTILSLGFFFF
jgi:hypothetical protein